jgi:hypothetical protein
MAGRFRREDAWRRLPTDAMITGKRTYDWRAAATAATLSAR